MFVMNNDQNVSIVLDMIADEWNISYMRRGDYREDSRVLLFVSVWEACPGISLREERAAMFPFFRTFAQPLLCEFCVLIDDEGLSSSTILSIVILRSAGSFDGSINTSTRKFFIISSMGDSNKSPVLWTSQLQENRTEPPAVTIVNLIDLNHVSSLKSVYWVGMTSSTITFIYVLFRPSSMLSIERSASIPAETHPTRALQENQCPPRVISLPS